jgi:hypothetical protein
MSSKEREPRPDDDLAEAQAKSKSVDERIPERADLAGDAITPPGRGREAYVPQAGLGAPMATDEQGPGEDVLELERKAQRSPKQPG